MSCENFKKSWKKSKMYVQYFSLKIWLIISVSNCLISCNTSCSVFMNQLFSFREYLPYENFITWMKLLLHSHAMMTYLACLKSFTILSCDNCMYYLFAYSFMLTEAMRRVALWLKLIRYFIKLQRICKQGGCLNYLADVDEVFWLNTFMQLLWEQLYYHTYSNIG